MNRRLFRFGLFLVLSFVVGSCSYFNDGYEETLDQFVSVAYKSPDADFSKYQTYSVSDALLYVDGEKSNRLPSTLANRLSAVVKEEMNALGYKLSPVGVPADLLVDLVFIKNTITSVTPVVPGYWWDWDWWWSEYYPYDPFFPYYPYPIYPITSSYSTGSLVIEMVDVTSVSKNDKAPVVWHGLIRSILSNDGIKNGGEDAIAKCFEMMPPKDIKRVDNR